MSLRSRRRVEILGLLIAWTLVVSGALALLSESSGPARAATCDQGGGLITGDWVITTTQVCSGILYTVDGSVTVNAGGSLTLINGGFSFSKDAAHTGYALTVNSGGTLILDGSLVTTQTTAIAPYLKLAVTVTGPNAQFTMRNGAVLKFPGWFNATGATIALSGSTITGFTPADISGTGLYVDDNDDGPIIAWSTTTATLYGSQISRIYENSSAAGGGPVSGIVEGNVSLLSSSTLAAYDSYIGVDYSNILGLHNELQVDGTSNAYLYNVTIDRTQDPVSETNWQPAYVPLASGGGVYLLRWLRAIVVDSTGFPVSGATIWSALSPGATTAQYPDNALSTTPSAATLAYLGRTASGANAWNRTDSNGVAVIPLYTDLITTASLPNAFSFGNYQLAVSYSTFAAQGGVSFPPYPAVTMNDNNRWVIVVFTNLQIRSGPDLALHPSDYTTTVPVIADQPFDVNARIYNQGQTAATGVSIAAYLDGSRSSQVARVDGLSVAAGQAVNQTLSISGVSVLGTHTLELVVDPDNTISEGGLAQENNNFANVTLNIQPAPSGTVAIIGPEKGAVITPGTSLTVTGYVRTTSLTGIGGVTVTIQLLYGTNVIASNVSRSGSDGFFLGTVAVPSDAPDGSYTVSVTTSAQSIQSDSRAISVLRPVPFLYSPVPLLGIAWWMFLIILAAIVAAFVGVTLYFKVYGLGKMVECGECGAFIPEDATRCPKCGVEFEKDMAKCSNCQAWVPADVKECPECGVQFATGQLDMTDYQEKMRLQYDEVVVRFKEEAQRQLGRALSDREFQDWWRKQPTFVTFEDWLHEEEDMRKMGSKPCPVCGTLNSVTARVCHKCGSAMREFAQAPSAGGSRVMAPRARAVRPSAGEAGSEEGSGGEQARPPTPPSAPVVQKRVIRMPTGESDQGSTQGSSENKGDEL